jgi:hypothetical protein
MEFKMIIITGYYEVNGTKSQLHQVHETFANMEEVEQYRQDLQNQTGHEINLIRKEKIQ